jgi:hypothetical protein
MPYYVDFSWKTDSHPLSAAQIEEWESIMRPALGGAGWVVMRQMNGIWYVEEARLAAGDSPDGSSVQADRRNAVKDALRQNGKTVGG